MKNFYSTIKKRLREIVKTNNKRPLVILGCVLFIVTNILFSFVVARFDFSSGHAYTLSGATKKILKDLDSKVVVKVFMSEDLPVRLLPLKTDVKNLLSEYRRFGRGKIEVIFVDPKKNTAAQKDAQLFGIPQLQFSQIEKDAYAVSQSYFGIALTKNTRTETIPQAVNMGSLEYDISAALYKLTSRQATSVGILEQQVQSVPQNKRYTLKNILQQQYSLYSIQEATQGAFLKIDPSSRVIMFFDSGAPVSQNSIGAFREYINNGGNAIFIVDGIFVDSQLGSYHASHGLFSLFEEYSIRLEKDLVFSPSAEVASFTTGRVSYFTPYPLWVKTADFDRSRPEFSNIGSLLFPWTSSLTLTRKNKATTFVRSPQNSWKQTEQFTLLPQAIAKPEKGTTKALTLVAQAQSNGGGSITVIPSSRFADEDFLAKRSDNIQFIVNLVNKYASGGALTGIRTRSLTIIPLKSVDDSTKERVKYINILLLPTLFGLVGLCRLYARTHVA